MFAHEDKLSHYQHACDREDIVKIRDDYRVWVDYYREQGYRIFDQDGTWVFKSMFCSKIWQDIIGHATVGTFMVPSNKWER